MPKKLLLHSLRLQLNHPLKRKKEKAFILRRLTLLDQQFCVNMDHNLYYSYLRHGALHKLWPVSTDTLEFIFDFLFLDTL